MASEGSKLVEPAEFAEKESRRQISLGDIELKKEILMRKILSVFVVLLFVAGCGGGDGSDGDAFDDIVTVTGPDPALITIDCSNPVFTHTEPFPSLGPNLTGNQSWHFIARGVDYWSCEEEDHKLLPDGIFTG